MDRPVGASKEAPPPASRTWYGTTRRQSEPPQQPHDISRGPQPLRSEAAAEETRLGPDGEEQPPPPAPPKVPTGEMDDDALLAFISAQERRLAHFESSLVGAKGKPGEG